MRQKLAAQRAPESIEKLVEYRTAHYASHSEAASYYTNTAARVQFRFANPIICELKSGSKIMRIDGGEPFHFGVGEVMYVAPGLTIDVDLGSATVENPIECNCFEIDSDHLNTLLDRVNERMKRYGNPSVLSLDWSAYSVLQGEDAQRLDLSSLMALFRRDRDVFTDLRIDSMIDDTVLKLMQARCAELLFADQDVESSGIHKVAHLIRQNLSRHYSTSELAQVAATSETSLHRQFRRFFGTTPARFANQLRISEAKRRLRQSRDQIEFLAFELGFSDASHFGREFRKSTGDSPAEYRKRFVPTGAQLDWQYRSSP